MTTKREQRERARQDLEVCLRLLEWIEDEAIATTMGHVPKPMPRRIALADEITHHAKQLAKAIANAHALIP